MGVAETVGAGGFEGAVEFVAGAAAGGRELGVGTPGVSIVSICSVGVHAGRGSVIAEKRELF